jgi:hypothetical protein
MRIARAMGVGMLGWIAFLGVALGAAVSLQTAGDHGAAVQIFARRVEQYAWLRARFEQPLPSFDADRRPWSLLLLRRYLASAIRTSRARATQEGIFAPPVDGFFRETIGDAIHDIDIEGLIDDGTEDPIDVMVNEPLPEWALHPVPTALLERLPAVPGAISYKMAAGALVLWDDHAEIVIDALPDAFVTR